MQSVLLDREKLLIMHIYSLLQINERIAGTIECSSFSDVKNLKLELDLFFMTKRAIELIERATRLSRESEAFLGALPCDEDGMPLDIIESLGLGVGCRNES